MKYLALLIIAIGINVAYSDPQDSSYHVYDIEGRTSMEDLRKLIDNLEHKLDQQYTLLRKSIDFSLPWTTILRRQETIHSDYVSFDEPWENYVVGFGKPNEEFFIGLQQLHDLTTYGPPQELLIILTDSEGVTHYANYDNFRIGNEAEKYALLELGAYRGNAGDGLSSQKGLSFSIISSNVDYKNTWDCEVDYHGGWWFDKGCHQTNLNGRYRYTHFNAHESNDVNGVIWSKFGDDINVKYAEMKIRPRL